MVAQFPEISQTAHWGYQILDFGNLVGSIARPVQIDSLNQDIDLRRLKPGDGRVKVKVEVGQVLELQRQEIAIPAGIFSQPVIGDHIRALLRFSHMIQAYGLHLTDAEQLGGFNTAVTCDYSELRID